MAFPDALPDLVTPYDRLAWTDEQVELLLASGEHRRELIAYFGAQEYEDLALLGRQARQLPLPDSAPRVFIVPGIMGSQLGLERQAPLPNDVLWLDPIDIAHGRLAALHLECRAPIVSLGAVLYTYLRLKLRLRTAGFAVTLHDYDWRLDVGQLGAAFAARLRNEPAARVMIVAHSLGGLVSRAALALPGTERVERVILLGTPNSGTFALVQALRGTYAVVRKLARLNPVQSAEWLAQEIFNSFPSLYHMLPAPRSSAPIDLYDLRQWPDSGPRPDGVLLARARGAADLLAAGDARFVTVVGVNQETVTQVARRRDDFVYTVTRHGDGTVPAACATLSGAQAYYTPIAHSELTRDGVVARAVVELLLSGRTSELQAEWRSHDDSQVRISDRQLRRTHLTKVDWAALDPEERRIFLQTLNEPPKLRLRAPRATSRSGATSDVRRS